MQFHFSQNLDLNLKGEQWLKENGLDELTGLGNQSVEIVMMATPDGHSRLELSRFIAPKMIEDHCNAPVNALGYLRVMFTVADIVDTLDRLYKRGT
jgi:hypothetical protein